MPFVLRGDRRTWTVRLLREYDPAEHDAVPVDWADRGDGVFRTAIAIAPGSDILNLKPCFSQFPEPGQFACQGPEGIGFLMLSWNHMFVAPRAGADVG
jgi:hypothetical protein